MIIGGKESYEYFRVGYLQMSRINHGYLNTEGRLRPRFANKNSTVPARFGFIALPFILGLIATQRIVLGGEIYFGELIAMLYLAFRFKPQQFLTIEKRFLQFALIWSAAQLLSDIVNDTNLGDSIKGVLAPVVFACTILGLLTYFRSNLKRMPSFLLGVTIGALLSVIFFPDDYAQGNPWKWGLGSGIVALIAIYSSFFQRGKSKFLLIAMLVIFLIVSLLFDARSLGGFPLISMLIYLAVRAGKHVWFSRLFGGDWGVARLLAVVVPLFLVANFLVSLVFSSESVLANFSDGAAEKYRVQASGTYGLILGGRSEILISSRAFLDSPLLGHGSWAHDKTGEYIKEYYGLVSQLGYSLNDDDTAAYALGLIPVHSYLMGGLVWAGIFGGLFWLYLLNQTIKNFIRFMSQLPYYYFLGTLLLVWNIFFSPFGASARWSSAVFLSSYFAFLFELAKQHKNKA
jgi:hypothetical protein